MERSIRSFSSAIKKQTLFATMDHGNNKETSRNMLVYLGLLQQPSEWYWVQKERLAHRELNNLIRQEYMAGYFELLPTDYCWFTNQMPEQLMRKDLGEKQDWLKIVHMARKDPGANCLTDPTRLYTRLLMTKFIHCFGQ